MPVTSRREQHQYESCRPLQRIPPPRDAAGMLLTQPHGAAPHNFLGHPLPPAATSKGSGSLLGMPRSLLSCRFSERSTRLYLNRTRCPSAEIFTEQNQQYWSHFLPCLLPSPPRTSSTSMSQSPGRASYCATAPSGQSTPPCLSLPLPAIFPEQFASHEAPGCLWRRWRNLKNAGKLHSWTCRYRYATSLPMRAAPTCVSSLGASWPRSVGVLC